MSLYDVLLVDQNATLDEIKLAFKRRALQVHPDKGGSKEEFHLVYQALETLGDPAARQKYDQNLATSMTGPPHASHASHPKEKKRKRGGKHAHPATSHKAKPQAKQKMPPNKSTTSAGKAPSKPPATAMPAEPQSKQTKLLMKIRDLLKGLPREVRNDVITNQFSQKQRVLLEKFMVDSAGTSSAQVYSEVKVSMDETPVEGCYALAVPKSKGGRRPDVRMTRAKPACKMKAKDKKAFNANARGSGCVRRAGSHSTLYIACISFDSFEMRTGNCCDLKSALEDLMILTSVKQKMRNHTGAGTFVDLLQAAVVSSAAEHGRNLADLKLSFLVFQSAGCFIGNSLRSPSIRSIELFGKIRCLFEPFRQYAKHLGRHNVYWHFSPVHLEDAWERFQSAVAEAWRIAGVDNMGILQKICSLYEAQAPFRIANLQRWEQHHMARQDENRHRHWRVRGRNLTGRLERWERKQMAMQDKNKHRPRHLRERNPTASLECRERGQMAMEDKNKHRPRHLRKRNPTASLECWERRQMAMEDKNEHRPKKLRQKLDLRKCTSESALSRQLSSLRKLIARWGHMLKRESKLLDQQRQRVLRRRKAQQKKDQEEQRRLEVLKQKQGREEERLRREWVRKRMRADLTMDDILGQKYVSNPDQKVMTIGDNVGGDGSDMSQKCSFSILSFYRVLFVLLVFCNWQHSFDYLCMFSFQVLWFLHMLASDGLSYVMCILLYFLVPCKVRGVLCTVALFPARTHCWNRTSQQGSRCSAMNCCRSEGSPILHATSRNVIFWKLYPHVCVQNQSRTIKMHDLKCIIHSKQLQKTVQTCIFSN